jgi:hypothetical protein
MPSVGGRVPVGVVAKPEIWSFLSTLSDPDRTLVFADFLLAPLDGHLVRGFHIRA